MQSAYENTFEQERFIYRFLVFWIANALIRFTFPLTNVCDLEYI